MAKKGITYRIYIAAKNIRKQQNILNKKYRMVDFSEADDISLEELDQIDAENRKLRNAKDKAPEKIARSIASTSIAVASSAYSLITSVSRFGLRGQDIQDQKTLQDHLVGMGTGIAMAYAAGPISGTMALVGTMVSELTNIVKDEVNYAYNKSIDASQKQILKERVGNAAYNSSRRG